MPLYGTINLHPSSHPPSALSSTSYDVICIGSGWAGRILAARVIKSGLSAVIIEEELIGGDCPFWACVPSKALLRPQEALDEARSVGGVKSRIVDPHLDVKGVLERRDLFAAQWDDGALLVPMVEGSGAAMVRGRGVIVGERQVKVGNVSGEEVVLEARLAVALCTGSEPVMPDIPGLVDAKPWGPRQAASSSVVPEHLIILGAGAVGTEMATIYSSLGARVSLIVSSKEMLPRVDPEAGALVRKALEGRGVKVHLSSTATSVKRSGDGSVSVQLSSGGVIQATEILIATGRKARTKDVGLEHFGIPVDGRPVKVDDSLRVPSVQGGWLYALGDVNGRAPLSHSSKYHGRIAANAIIARADSQEVEPTLYSSFAATGDIKAQPQVVFTTPTVASVGLTRSGAKATGKQVREITAPLATLGAKLHADGYEDGWAQWIVDESSGALIGATFVGANAAELLHASTVAIVGELTLDRLAHAVPSFPTMSEVYLNLLEAAGI